MFQPHQQRQARARRSPAALRGVVSQRLLPRAGGRGRVPAVEVLVVNSRVAERIAQPDRLGELEHEMVDGRPLRHADLRPEPRAPLPGWAGDAAPTCSRTPPSRVRCGSSSTAPTSNAAAAPTSRCDRRSRRCRTGTSSPQAQHEPGAPLPQRVAYAARATRSAASRSSPRPANARASSGVRASSESSRSDRRGSVPRLGRAGSSSNGSGSRRTAADRCADATARVAAGP